jgi:hypothetical protein
MFNYQEYSCFASTPNAIQTAPPTASATSSAATSTASSTWYLPLIQNISEATKFQQTNEAKAKALDILKYSLLIGEDRITPHTERIITSLIKISQLD